MIQGMMDDVKGTGLCAGKISTGYGPNEGPNTKNAPMKLPYFLLTKQEIVKDRVGDKIIERQKWVENKVAQAQLKLLAETVHNISQPKKLDASFLGDCYTIEDVWHTRMAWYDSSSGLTMCTSQGLGTEATYVERYDSNNIPVHSKRVCTKEECPYRAAGQCKMEGTLLVWPKADAQFFKPYKYTTTSKWSVINITRSLTMFYEQMKIANVIKKLLNPENSKPFMGLNGIKFTMIRNEMGGSNGNHVTNIEFDQRVEKGCNEIINQALGSKIKSPNGAIIDFQEIRMIASSLDIDSGIRSKSLGSNSVTALLEDKNITEGDTVPVNDMGSTTETVKAVNEVDQSTVDPAATDITKENATPDISSAMLGAMS